jgi:hypothetical protein
VAFITLADTFNDRIFKRNFPNHAAASQNQSDWLAIKLLIALPIRYG